MSSLGFYGEDQREKAKRKLVHYFQTVSGHTLDSDNEWEIREIVDHIIEAVIAGVEHEAERSK